MKQKSECLILLGNEVLIDCGIKGLNMFWRTDRETNIEMLMSISCPFAVVITVLKEINYFSLLSLCLSLSWTHSAQQEHKKRKTFNLEAKLRCPINYTDHILPGWVSSSPQCYKPQGEIPRKRNSPVSSRRNSLFATSGQTNVFFEPYVKPDFRSSSRLPRVASSKAPLLNGNR
jgi:hypothetical protein